jgi:hypothetical protein
MNILTQLNGNGGNMITGPKRTFFDSLVSWAKYNDMQHYIRIYWDSGAIENSKTIAGTQRELDADDSGNYDEHFGSVFAVEFIAWDSMPDEQGNHNGAFFMMPATRPTWSPMTWDDVNATQIDASVYAQ